MDIPTKCLCSSQGIHVAELKILAPLKKNIKFGKTNLHLGGNDLSLGVCAILLMGISFFPMYLRAELEKDKKLHLHYERTKKKLISRKFKLQKKEIMVQLFQTQPQ